MGKQSSRLYYQGKDHKEIYYQGHYHDAMYIGSELVWEKVKGDEAIEWIYGLTYIQGKYYVVTRISTYDSQPVLYEGSDLKALKKRGRIWGSEATVSGSCMLYHNSDEIVIIMADKSSPTEYSVARVPITESGADMGNISYNLDGEYWYSGCDDGELLPTSNRYMYGNGNYYCNYYLNGDYTEFDDVGSSGVAPFANGGKLYLLPGYGVSPYGGYFNMNNGFALYASYVDDEENVRITNKISLDALKDDYMTRYPNASFIMIAANTTLGKHGVNHMVSKTVGYRQEYITAYNGSSEYYLIKFDLNSSSILDYEHLDGSSGCGYVLSQMFDDEYRVQIRYKGSAYNSSLTGELSYGLIGDDFRNDVYISSDDIEDNIHDLYALDIKSMARNGNEIILKMSYRTENTDADFIIIDMENGTAKRVDDEVFLADYIGVK